MSEYKFTWARNNKSPKVCAHSLDDAEAMARSFKAGDFTISFVNSTGWRFKLPYKEEA